MAALAEALQAPFEASEVKFKAQVVQGNRCLAVPYVNARAVMDRLDEVFGLLGWQDAYTPLPDGTVICALTVFLSVCPDHPPWTGPASVTRCDVGAPSEQPDEGDRRKAAFSDALKRAAVKLGIGRYLYRVEPQWLDYDLQKKRIVGTPRLPPSALPRRQGSGVRGQGSAEEDRPAAKGNGHAPRNGAELYAWLLDRDRKLSGEGLIDAGMLLNDVTTWGIQEQGMSHNMAEWLPPWNWLGDFLRDYERSARARKVAAAAPPPAAPSKASAEQLKRLAALEAAKGFIYADVAKILKLPGLVGELTAEQCEQAIKSLEQEPDKPVSRGRRKREAS
jgi:hypothetical protein